MNKPISADEQYNQKMKDLERLKEEINRLKEMAEIQDRHLSFEEECQQKLQATKAELLKTRISKEIELKEYEKALQNEINDISTEKSTGLYDMILHIDSFQRIQWLLERPQEDQEDYIKNPPDQIVIGIMGREKVGKSFLLGKLSGVQLPVGYSIQTQGLSIKHSKKDYIKTTCLDSAGVHAPVYYYDQTVNEKFIPKTGGILNQDVTIKTMGPDCQKPNLPEENEKKNFESLHYSLKENLKMQMINDRKLTETFIEDFILFVSKVILIVVGQLSQDDQAIIERIRREYKEKKYIIIVHNFMYLSSEESIKAQIQRDIFQSCEVEERGIPGTSINYFCEKLDQTNPSTRSKYQIAHFIYCQENTEIGKAYNQACIRHIWDKIKTIDERDKFNIIESLQKFFKLNYKNYIKIIYNGKNPKSDGSMIEDHFYDKEPFADLVFDSEKSIVSLGLKDDFLVSPQNPTFTALGSLIINNLSEFEPKFELIEYADNEFVAAFEICNLDLESLKLEITREINNENILIVRGNKVQMVSGSKKKLVTFLGTMSPFGGIKYGVFEKLVSLSSLTDKYYFKEGKLKWSYNEGVLFVYFQKNVKESFKKPFLKG